MPRKAKPLAERLDANSEPYVEGRCQLWLGGKSGGYGVIQWRGRAVKVHRAAWECEHGPIPPFLCVLHTCDNPPCRNIDHLFLGTDADNVADCVAKGRRAWINRNGENNGQVKLTGTEVFEIRAIQPDVPQWVIAAMYGVSPSAVSRIKGGRRWQYSEV